MHHRLFFGILSLLIIITNTAYAQSDQEQRIETLEEQVNILTEVLENRIEQTEQNRTHIGGYGELHYNNLEEVDGDKTNKIDFHRFVLFFSHDFSDNIRFISELELEHSLAKDTDDGSGPGEVELEQAYIEIDHNDSSSTQAGLFLVPIGIINETHEPPVFYGVERNDVENVIIPSTWWEAGIQHIRRFGQGWQWNIALHSGLEIPTSSFRVRSGRQKVAEALASSLAYTTRIKYTGSKGLEWAASYQVQNDPSQVAGDGLDKGNLFETHIDYKKDKLGIKALYAAWDFSGSAVEGAANDADAQDGWYVEPSYKATDKLGFFARFSEVNAARSRDNFEQTEIGLNWWPHENVVFKFDWRKREHSIATEASSRDFDGFDLGVGYHF